MAERRQDRAAGAGGCPRSCPGRTLLSAQRKGGRAESAPSAAQGAWRGQGASPGPGVMLGGAQVGSLQLWGGFGWTDGLGYLTHAKRSASSRAPEAQEGSQPGHADPTMSHHMASTVTHHAAVAASHRAAASMSHCGAPTTPYRATATASHCTAPTTYHRASPTMSHPTAPTMASWVVTPCFLPHLLVAFFGSLPAASTRNPGLRNLRLKNG